jgi:hypothetical protein
MKAEPHYADHSAIKGRFMDVGDLAIAHNKAQCNVIQARVLRWTGKWLGASSEGSMDKDREKEGHGRV